MGRMHKQQAIAYKQQTNLSWPQLFACFFASSSGADCALFCLEIAPPQENQGLTHETLSCTL